MAQQQSRARTQRLPLLLALVPGCRAQRRHSRAGGLRTTSGALAAPKEDDEDTLPVGDPNCEFVPTLTDSQRERIQSWVNEAYDLPPEDDDTIAVSSGTVDAEHNVEQSKPSSGSLSDLRPPTSAVLDDRTPSGPAAVATELHPPVSRLGSGLSAQQPSASQLLARLFSGVGLCAPPLHMRASYLETALAAAAEAAQPVDLPNQLYDAPGAMHSVEVLQPELGDSIDVAELLVTNAPQAPAVPIPQPARATTEALMHVVVPDDEETGSPWATPSLRGLSLGARPALRPGASFHVSPSSRLAASPRAHFSNSPSPHSPVAGAPGSQLTVQGGSSRALRTASLSGTPQSPTAMLAGSLAAATEALYRSSEAGASPNFARRSRRLLEGRHNSGRITPSDVEAGTPRADGPTSGVFSGAELQQDGSLARQTSLGAGPGSTRSHLW